MSVATLLHVADPAQKKHGHFSTSRSQYSKQAAWTNYGFRLLFGILSLIQTVPTTDIHAGKTAAANCWCESKLLDLCEKFALRLSQAAAMTKHISFIKFSFCKRSTMTKPSVSRLKNLVGKCQQTKRIGIVNPFLAAWVKPS